MQFKSIQGINVPEIGLGTYNLYGRECYKAVRYAFEIGYRHIDTAQMYKNEKEIGEAIRKSGLDREDIFLTTKVWHTNLEHDDVLQTVEDSLKEFNTPYVDLLLIHWPNHKVSFEKTFEAMLILKEQSKTLNIGVSNFTLSMMKHALEELRVPLLCNQVEFHPFLGQFDLLDYSYDNDFLVTAYSPLAKGNVSNDQTLTEIGNTHGKTAAQVALRWLIEQENVVAIPKASSEDHLRENLDIFDFALTDEQFEAIDALDKSKRFVNPTFAPDWD
jgi:2,5-diketo-D-gluconate reductase B